MKSRSKTLFVVLPILLLCVGGIWYWRKNADDRAAMSYLTETVRRGEILATVNASGELDAVVSVDVGAQVSGQIERLYVELGQQVKKGDLIAEIDSTTQRNELEKSKAQLASYEAQLAARKTALDIAQTRYDRELKLRRSDSTSRENLESAQQTLASARADVAEMESQITQTRLAVSTAETNLGYTRISAPLDGTVVSVPVEEGQTVNANQTTPTIVQVADLSRMENKIEISEGDITRVTPGMPVIYTILSEPDISFRARLDSIDPGNTSVTDASSSSSVSSSSSSSSGDAVYYYGKSVVSNEDGRLRIGMTTQNTIIVSRAQDVLIVPSIVLEKRMETRQDKLLRPGAHSGRRGGGTRGGDRHLRQSEHPDYLRAHGRGTGRLLHDDPGRGSGGLRRRHAQAAHALMTPDARHHHERHRTERHNQELRRGQQPRRGSQGRQPVHQAGGLCRHHRAVRFGQVHAHEHSRLP